ncbi:hypothetical protein N7533_002442 [Penicillium manginii]|uniref:uncharacterized protein n=1 Tax=Penicillium manginii TaxID=203109 RepID=UPI002548E471|nr:uncharacterized protein N7533_002442 [Penicillium manginii]KAJ5763761.1 hypothetical protein N7533_002442 [Penicillium manginii]
MSYHSASPEGVHLSPTSDNSPTALPVSATAPRPPSDSSRSCVTCRRRKVRCNKPPRKSKRPPDAELLSRLRRLEGVIEHLSGKNGESGGGSTTSLSPTQPTPATIPSIPSGTASAPPVPTSSDAEKKPQNGGCPFEDADPKMPLPRRFENEFGRLVIEEGKSRYVSNRLWASLGDEIEELQDILDHSSSDEEDTASKDSPESSHSGSHDGFLFGFYALSQSMREFHPPFQKISIFWEVYKENVAPLICILHTSSTRNLLIEAAQNPDGLDKNSEALVFSIYLSAIVSLSPEECLLRFGEERGSAVKRYRFAVEQALARANLLNTQSLGLLQAAVLFLICVRREDDSKFVWSMTSIILRLAQGLGLHRDGTNFALQPFETEMRRRLWWHICLLDVRASEDHGTDSQINESMYDTRLPLNVNDDDISPEMTETPTEREGFTDVTFCLIRCEITCALRRANYGCSATRFSMGNSGPSIENCERMIHIISSRVEERYIKHCDMNIPIHWAAATVGRLILAKLWLVVHHPMTRKDRVTSVSQATRQSLFLTAIEVLEFGRLLEVDPKTAKWGWLFRTNMQWHGVAFVLSEVCVRPICPVTDRAWNAISSLYGDWKSQATHKKGMLWRPLAALMKRAATSRAKQQAELRSKFGPNPIPYKHSTVEFAAAHHHTLPHIHMPTDSPAHSPLPVQGPVSDSNPNPLDIDLSQGPWEAVQNIFGDSNILAPAMLDNPPLQNPTLAPAPTPMPLSTLPTGINFNSPPFSNINGINNPFIAQETIPEPAPLGWEEWDQVMRDFQMDVENENGPVPAQGINVTEWFA